MPKGVYPHKGHPLTAEQRQAISARMRAYRPSPETRAKYRAAKLANPVRYWLGRARGSMPPEQRAKISVANKGCPAPFSKRHFWYRNIRMRSSYEIRVAEALDMLGILWQYESRQFDLGAFTYTPDFYLPQDDAFWEVKGWFGPKSVKKVQAFRTKYPEIPLVVFTGPCVLALERAAETAHIGDENGRR